MYEDVRLAWRGLWRARGFTAAAVLTLALGTAGASVMFAIVQGVLLRPLAVRAQDRLLVAWKELRASGFTHYPFGGPDVEAVGESSQLLERVAGVTSNGALPWVLKDRDLSDYAHGALVTGGFFEVLGVHPVLGRLFTVEDDVAGAEPVLVIGERLWHRRYGGSSQVIGRRVTIGEQVFTIVGVAPQDVGYPYGTDVWRTVKSVSIAGVFGDAARYELDLIGRLRDGATIEQAAGELEALVRRLEKDAPPDTPRGLIPVVQSYDDLVLRDVRPAILVLFAAVVFVLVIASANVSNLLLVRGEARRSEFAVRAALGAGRGRLARQVLVESLLLALAAAALGLATAWGSLPTVLALVPDGVPRVDSVRIDATVVLVTAAIGSVSAALAGLAPALSSARIDLASQLRSGGRGALPTSAKYGRRALVVAQVALAVTVVCGAGLLGRTFQRLQSADIGLAADQMVFVELLLPQPKYALRERHLQLLDDLIARFAGVPRILSATPVSVAPFSGTGGWDVPRFTVEGQTADRAATNPSLNLESVHPGYFETFGIPLVRGRFFTGADGQGAQDVAIVSENVAERVWPGRSGLGSRIKMGGPDSDDPWRTIVGVVKATRYRELAEPRPTLYLPAEQFLVMARTIVLRTDAPMELVGGLARDVVQAVDPDVQVLRVVPFKALLERPLARPRFNAFLIGAFGIAALLLAAVGLYAVLAAHVRDRAAEIGVRVALGATSADIRGLVLFEGLTLAAAGAALGMAASFAATRLLRSLLFGIDAMDPVNLVTAALVLIVASALATWVPARRAVRLDPVALLRGSGLGGV